MLRWFAYPLGVAAIFGALIGLTMPVNLSAADRTGSAITCGTPLSPSLGTARHEDTLNSQLHQMVGSQYRTSDYAGQCESLVALKFRVALPVAALGGLAIAIVLAADVVAVGARARRRSVGMIDPSGFSLPVTPVGGAHP